MKVGIWKHWCCHRSTGTPLTFIWLVIPLQAAATATASSQPIPTFASSAKASATPSFAPTTSTEAFAAASSP